MAYLSVLEHNAFTRRCDSFAVEQWVSGEFSNFSSRFVLKRFPRDFRRALLDRCNERLPLTGFAFFFAEPALWTPTLIIEPLLWCYSKLFVKHTYFWNPLQLCPSWIFRWPHCVVCYYSMVRRWFEVVDTLTDGICRIRVLIIYGNSKSAPVYLFAVCLLF